MPSSVVVDPAIPFGIGSNKFAGFSKLIEECGEVLQELGKSMGAQSLDEHWDDKGDLKMRIENELGDLSAAMNFVIDENDLDFEAITRRGKKKLKKFRKWHENIQAGRDPNDDG